MEIKKYKTLLKKIPVVKKVAFLKNKYRADKTIKKNILNYENDYLKYSTDLSGNYDDRSRRRLIIIGTHIIEKGLSHSDFRPGFGRQKIIELQENIAAYEKAEDVDFFAIENAISILHLYHTTNESFGFHDEDYVDTKIFEKYRVKQMNPYDLNIRCNYTVDECEHIFSNRHSVRIYDQDGEPISNQVLEDVIELTNTAPSACNRQATHVFAVAKRDLFEEIENIHGGCKGFGRHASLFLFVTSDLSLYSSNEVKLPIYDAGIYTMNLLYALQAYGLYACPLNASLPGKSEVMHRLIGIPDKFDINGIIAVYKLKSGTRCKIAASPRRKAKDVLTIFE